MKITRFNNDNLKPIRERLEIAVAMIAEETGLDIKVGSCRFNRHTATYKLEINTVDQDGNAFDEDAANFKVFAEDVGLREEDLGKTFINNRKLYTVTGLKPRNRKYPILATRADGKRFKFPASLVKRLLHENSNRLRN
jgi:hypothetical protein